MWKGFPLWKFLPTAAATTLKLLAFGQKLVAECAKYGASLGYQWAQFGAGENEMSVEQIQAIEDRGAQIAKGHAAAGLQSV